MKKTILLTVIFAVILVGAFALYQILGSDAAPDRLATQPPQTTAAAADTTAPEETVPNFPMQSWDGETVTLEDFRGKNVILNFWASWCGPCKAEMPDFDTAYTEYGDEIHFIMLNVTDGNRETVETAKAFIEDAGYTFPVYFDTTQAGAYSFGAYSIPMTFFIDKDGHLVAYGQGTLSAENLQQGIDMLT